MFDEVDDPLIDRINRFACAFDRTRADIAGLELIERPLGQPRCLDRTAFNGSRYENIVAEEAANHRHHVDLRLIVGIMARD
jgi:hypothetical protein